MLSFCFVKLLTIIAINLETYISYIIAIDKISLGTLEHHLLRQYINNSELNVCLAPLFF